MDKILAQEKTYTTFQVADICGVRPGTIILWAKQKKIKTYTTLGGHRRILESDLVEFLKNNRIPLPSRFSRSTRVLIVEDDKAVGRLLQKTLQRAPVNLTVEWIQDGVSALLGLGKSPPDLIVLDVVMPVVDGASVLATLRSDPATQNVKVIGITGKKLAPEKLAFMKKNTDLFLIKPFDIGKFTASALSLLQVMRSDAAQNAKK